MTRKKKKTIHNITAKPTLPISLCVCVSMCAILFYMKQMCDLNTHRVLNEQYTLTAQHWCMRLDTRDSFNVTTNTLT